MMGADRETTSADKLRTVVVLGLARSGTSVVTGILEILGADMGPAIQDESNPRGSHEDIDFAAFHREIFELAGPGTGYWNPPPKAAILALRPQVDAAVRELLRKKSEGKTLWGWKHARTLLTYDLFLPYLVDPHFILVFRNPIGTALSSVEHTRRFRQPVDLLQAFKVAQFYHGEMLQFLENHPDLPKLFVSYEEVAADPVKEAARMARFLDVELPAETAAAVAESVIPREKLPTEKAKMRSFWRRKLPRLLPKWRRRSGGP